MSDRSRVVPAVAAALVLGGIAAARGSTAEWDVHAEAGMDRDMARHTHEARCILQAALSRPPPGTDPVQALERRLRPSRGDASAALEEARLTVDLALHEPVCPEEEEASGRRMMPPGS